MLNNLLRLSHFSAVALSAFSVGSASANSNERHRGETSRQVVCTQGSKELLRFNAFAGQAEYVGDAFTLSVQTRGDDLGGLTLTNRETGDVLEALLGEEFLSAKLSTDENSENPVTDKTFISVHGTYTLNLTAPSGDVATISAGGRRGERSITVSLQTDESPNSALQITCRREK